MRTWLVLGLVASLAGCSGESSEELDGGDVDGGLGGPDGGEVDAGADGGSVADCPTEGRGTLAIDITSEVPADVRVTDSEGMALPGDPSTESREVEVAAGFYDVRAHRVRAAGDIVGPAYQGAVEGPERVCVRADDITTVEVVYTKEPGSEKLWLTNTNGEGQILAFDAEQLSAAGEQAPSVTLDGKLTSPSALAVDGFGRLWVGETAGTLVGFDQDRLGDSSDAGPDIVLSGPTLCGATLPCGPRAIAFDAAGDMWVAVLDRIVKLAATSIEATGEPDAAVTITSPDAARPQSMTFDAAGNLWVGAEDNFVKFARERLDADITDEAADVVIEAMNPPPVIIGLGGPSGLTFDREGNLWAGFFGPNVLARFTPEELEESATITPSVLFELGALALLTDLAIDDSGNLWMPGASGTIARFDAAELTEEEPTPVILEAPGVIGSAERIALHAVAGPLFIAP